MEGFRLPAEFYLRDVLIVAPELVGKDMIIRLRDGTYGRYTVTEVEAYRGTDDKACHASRGRTVRTEIMFHQGGSLYVYFIYGMYWMLNVVTGDENDPQAILIRGVNSLPGPGRLTKALGIDGSYYGENLNVSDRIWFEDVGFRPDILTGERIGVDYAGEYWRSMQWRFFI